MSVLFKPLMRLQLIFASTLVLLSPMAQSATWFDLPDQGSTHGVTVEVDLESLRSNGERRQLVARITSAQPRQRQEIRFQSVVADLEIFCDSGLAIWKTARFFSGDKVEGTPLSSENFGVAGLPSDRLNLLPNSIWATLQRSACGQGSTISP